MKTISLLMVFLILSFAAYANEIGLSYNQVMKNLVEFFPIMEESPLANGAIRYTGKANNGLSTLEVYGKKGNIDGATIMMFTPNDSESNLLINAAIIMQFVHSLFPNKFKEVGDWVNTNLKSNSDDTYKRTFDDKEVEIILVKAMGMVTISVKHPHEQSF